MPKTKVFGFTFGVNKEGVNKGGKEGVNILSWLNGLQVWR